MASRFTVDVPLLFIQLLKERMDYKVTGEPTDQDLASIPTALAVVESTSPTPVINGPLGAATRFTLNFTVLAASRSKASAEADRLYGVVAGLAGKAAAAGVVVKIDVPTEPSLLTHDGDLYQYRFPATGIARKA